MLLKQLAARSVCEASPSYCLTMCESSQRPCLYFELGLVQFLYVGHSEKQFWWNLHSLPASYGRSTRVAGAKVKGTSLRAFPASLSPGAVLTAAEEAKDLHGKQALHQLPRPTPCIYNYFIVSVFEVSRTLSTATCPKRKLNQSAKWPVLLRCPKFVSPRSSKSK